jgi:hypothetical protein
VHQWGMTVHLVQRQQCCTPKRRSRQDAEHAFLVLLGSLEQAEKQGKK